ncbi:MAG: LamG domain-containing protein, partial [Candidatus Micrarchaeia archaeon]
GSWNFNEGTGTTARDSSGNNNDGTLTGPKWAAGKFRKGLSFDGVDDYVDVLDSDSLDLADSITISAWIKINSGSTGQRVILEKTGAYRLMVRHEPFRHLEAWLWLPEDAGVSTFYDGDPISFDQWHHVALTYDRSFARAYLDGVEQWSVAKTSPLNINIQKVWIGQGWSFFDGLIDEVKVYSKALSVEEVLSDMNCGHLA